MGTFNKSVLDVKLPVVCTIWNNGAFYKCYSHDEYLDTKDRLIALDMWDQSIAVEGDNEPVAGNKVYTGV